MGNSPVDRGRDDNACLCGRSTIPESTVLVPSDMIAIGDASFGDVVGFGWPAWCDAGPHNWRNNGVFCDGQVETCRSDLFPKDSVPGAFYSWFRPDAAHAKRWNNDNQRADSSRFLSLSVISDILSWP